MIAQILKSKLLKQTNSICNIDWNWLYTILSFQLKRI